MNLRALSETAPDTNVSQQKPETDGRTVYKASFGLKSLPLPLG